MGLFSGVRNMGRNLVAWISDPVTEVPVGEARRQARPARAASARPAALPSVIPGITKEADGSLWAEGWFLRQVDLDEAARDFVGGEALTQEIEAMTSLKEVVVIGRLLDPSGSSYLLVTHGPRKEARCLTLGSPTALLSVRQIWLGRHGPVIVERSGAGWVEEFRLRQMPLVSDPVLDTLQKFAIIGRIIRPTDRAELVVASYGEHDDLVLVLASDLDAVHVTEAPKLLIDRPRR